MRHTRRLIRAFLVSLLLVSGACGGGEQTSDVAPDSLGGDDAADVMLGEVVDVQAGEVSDAQAELLSDLETPQDLVFPTYDGPAGAVAIFEKVRTQFYDQPFPSDLRRKVTGAPDLSDYPNPYGNAMLAQYMDVAQKYVDGFSPNGTVYVRFDGPVDLDSLPSPSESLQPDSPIQLVNVSSDSQRYGERIPLEFGVFNEEPPVDNYYMEPYLLKAHPVGGFPMAFGDKYALLVLRSVKDDEGHHLSRTPTVASALDGDASSFLYSLLSPVRTLLEDDPLLRPEDVAVTTVFTVADPVAELVNSARYVWQEVDIEVTAAPVEYGAKTDYFLLEGTYLAPNFQVGEPPYEQDGNILFDAQGNPVVQRWESIPFVITLPRGDMPAGGWPVVEYSHGTGGSRKSFTYDGTAAVLAGLGLAGISVDQPIHGARWDGPSEMLELYSFNFLNPSSARCLFRQAALDNVILTKALQTMEFEHGGATHTFNTDRVGYFGHSQGGITGAMFVAVEDGIQGALLSGAGGGLAYTILLRKEIDSSQELDIEAMLKAVLNLQFEDELDILHPVLTLMQMLIDASDPINYSPLYFYPRIRQLPLNVMFTEGVEDPYTPAVTTENLAIAGRIPRILPTQHENAGFALAGLNSLAMPVQSNMELPDGTTATAGLAQFADYGHFVAFDEQDCIDMWSSFLQTALVPGAPVIDR